MKKFLVFVALAMVFILLTSGLAIGRKAAEDEPAESSDVTTATTVATTEASQLNFYIEDNLLQPATSAADLAGANFDGCVGYFEQDGKTYFFQVVNFSGAYAEKEMANSNIWINDLEKKTYGDRNPTFGYTFDFEKITMLSEKDDFFAFPKESGTSPGFIAVIILVMDSSEIVGVVPLQIAQYIQEQNYGFQAADPGEIEGPSADITTEATTETTTAPPQVDIPWPEEPGAE